MTYEKKEIRKSTDYALPIPYNSFSSNVAAVMVTADYIGQNQNIVSELHEKYF